MTVVQPAVYWLVVTLKIIPVHFFRPDAPHNLSNLGSCITNNKPYSIPVGNLSVYWALFCCLTSLFGYQEESNQLVKDLDLTVIKDLREARYKLVTMKTGCVSCFLLVMFAFFGVACCCANEASVSVVKADLKVYRARFSEITPQ